MDDGMLEFAMRGCNGHILSFDQAVADSQWRTSRLRDCLPRRDAYVTLAAGGSSHER
jgi:hypothetical protein